MGICGRQNCLIVNPHDHGTTSDLQAVTMERDSLLLQIRRLENEVTAVRDGNEKVAAQLQESNRLIDVIKTSFAIHSCPPDNRWCWLCAASEKIQIECKVFAEKKATEKRKCLTAGLIKNHGQLNCELEDGHDGNHRKTVNDHPFYW